MKKLVLHGRVLPERVPLSIGTTIKWHSDIPDFGLKLEVEFSIADSQVIATIGVKQGKADIDTLRNVIDLQIRSVVDLIGYLHGVRYELDIVSAASTDGDGGWRIFGINIPVLSERRRTASAEEYPSLGNLPVEWLTAVSGDIPAQMALADFRRAMTSAISTGFYCYRAIESIMQSVRTDDKEKESVAWDRMRQHLRIDRAAIDMIKKHADFPRHGRPSSISDSDRAAVFKVADEIVRRYLHYLVRGKSQLPNAQFPRFTI
jgi:hypothetical protein